MSTINKQQKFRISKASVVIPQEETSKSSSEIENQEKLPNLNKKFLKHLIGIFIFLLLLTLLLGYFYWYISSFSQAAGTSISNFKSELMTGWQQEIDPQESQTFLILGIDEIEDQHDGSLLTDTMMLASYHPKDSKLKVLSIPRDLWLEAYKTKINAIYYYGEQSDSITGSLFTQDVVQEVTGVKVDHVLVMKLRYLSELINLLNGVPINIAETFTDTKFPRGHTDTKSTDPEKLYETITFEAGPIVMNGETAMKYIRSRQSTSLNEGTDIARGHRQQQLIQAIIKKIMSKETLKNPYILGSLYKWFGDYLATESFSIATAVSLAKASQVTPLTIESVGIPIESDDQTGLLYTPDIEKHNLWVYEPRDQSWRELQAFITQHL